MTTTPVPTCADDLIADIEADLDARDRCLQTDQEHRSISSIRALLARLRAAEKEIGMHRRFQHSQMNDITVPVLKLAQDLGVTGGSAAEDVQAMVRHVRAAEVDAGRYRWLRDRIENGSDMVIAKCDEWSIESWSGDDPDAAIDAAIQETKQ